MSGTGDGLEVGGACTTGAIEQAASIPTIAANKKPTRNGRPIKKRGFCMGLILLEALLALFIFIAIVWWTMFSGRSKGELRQAQPPSEQPPNDIGAHGPGHAVSEAAPTTSTRPEESRH
jgi:hypothetical protein